MTDFRIDPDRLRAIVLESIALQPAEVAQALHRSVTWHGVDVQPVKDQPDRYVIFTAGTPLAFVARHAIEDTEHGVTGGLSTPEGYRK